MTDHNPGDDSDFRSRELDLRRELELAKINNELDIKQRELVLAEKRIVLDERNLKGKGVSEFKAALISVIAAIVAAFGTFIAAYYAGFFDVEKTNVTSNASLNLAKLQFSNDLIKNALSSNNPANSLLFYADVGLLEGLKSDSVKVYAEEENKRIKKGDQGPSLLPSFANASVSNASLWLDADLLRAVAPDADPRIVVALTTIGNYILTGFEINKNNKRLSMFLGQIAHETNGFRLIVESGNASEQALTRIWPKLFDQPTAKVYAKKPDQILNRAYANRMGNGPESSGDGWRFRGRGFFLITGRLNYERMSRETGINLIESPELAEDPNVALLIAATYWYNANLNTFADEGRADQITKRINGGLNGLDSRNKYAELALNALQK